MSQQSNLLDCSPWDIYSLWRSKEKEQQLPPFNPKKKNTPFSVLYIILISVLPSECENREFSFNKGYLHYTLWDHWEIFTACYKPKSQSVWSCPSTASKLLLFSKHDSNNYYHIIFSQRKMSYFFAKQFSSPVKLSVESDFFLYFLQQIFKKTP